jgi:hypothetical protein
MGQASVNAEPDLSSELDRKGAERDALINWLQTLERDDACPESRMLVQAELDRVLQDRAACRRHSGT